MESKDCIFCGTTFYKKAVCSKKNWWKSKYCSKKCQIPSFNKAGSDATRGTKLSAEEKMKSHYFQKWHTKHWLEHLEKWRTNWWEVWNKGMRWEYHLKDIEDRITELTRSIRTSHKNLDWRDSILKRDNMECVDCKIKWVKLHVHHIIPFRDILLKNNIHSVEDSYNCSELWDIENWKTLCVDCHNKIHH